METSSALRSVHDNDDEQSPNGHAVAFTAAEYNLSDEARIRRVSHHFAEIMKIIGLDLNEDGLKDTPGRVARMYVKEIFKGLNSANEPSVALFKNKGSHNKLILEKNITLHSFCEHHFLPIIGKAHIAYISNGKIIGLSKLNRIVHYYASKPQVQERLTEEIANALKKALGTEDVAVIIDAVHLCVTTRGVNDTNCSTVTSYFGGKFHNEDVKTEVLISIR
ncbi:MAG TPA: GTP cyclohydrolase I FolE [Chitinophagaceae bacterium]|nr:GTP cyclohydrolase I FolE [Chitinophagaceae bacterium]